MKIAIVGCGNIANVHAKALGQLGQTLALAVGTDPSRAAAFGKKWGAKETSVHMEDALAPDIDVIHICTPPALHYEMVKQALAAGKHILCEKPLALTAAEGKELADIAKQKGLLGAVNFNSRFHEACVQAKALIHSPGFGPIHFLHGCYLQEFHLLPADYMWRYDGKLARPMRAVTEIGSHWIDMARYWSGLEVEAVSAAFGYFQPDRVLVEKTMYAPGNDGEGETVRIDSEDAAVATFRFSGGALGSMVLSEVSSGRSNYLSMEVSGTKGAVWWNSEDPYRLNQSAGKSFGHNTRVNAFGGGFPDTFSAFFTKVYGALSAGYDPDASADYPTLEDGYRNAAVCEAIYQSAHNQSAWTQVLYT